MYFEDSIPFRKYRDSTTNVLFFAKFDKETGRYLSHGITPSAYCTAYGYNYYMTYPSIDVKNNQVFAQTTYFGHLKGKDTNYYTNYTQWLAFIRWKDNGYIIDVKNFPTTASIGRASNTIINDNGEMILTGMFNNNISFGDINLTSYTNSTAYIVKFGSDPSFLVRFVGGDTLNDREPTLNINNLLESTNNEIILYPNPAKDEVNIISSNEFIKGYYLYNSCGQAIITNEKIKTKTKKIDISTLPKGVYVLKVRTYKNVFTRKVVKN